ncbi:MAG: septum formation inhibitor Maf [Firmicutes bacterium]|nr:septum formation inhibitor Maf [Bacillota bacterium]
MEKIILASSSPRRKELFKLLDLDFEIVKSEIEEVINPDLPQDELVTDLAFQKATDVFAKHQNRVVLGFDTLVYIDDEVFGKPKDLEDARRMLRMLSGNTHTVVTGCAIISKKISKSFYTKTNVSFYPLLEKEIEDYIKTNEPLDKAGAYAIQGFGSKFIQTINGDYFTVMGLPLSRLYHELKELNIIE